jgi:chromosome partitioning protein
MAIVTVITNNKGGVAKTTTAVNLAAALRVSGFDVLCIDLDGQRNLTDTFGVDTSTAKGTTFDTLRERITPYVPAVRVRPSTGKGVGVLDVLPATRDLFAVEVLLSDAADRLTRFGEVVAKYRDKYDVIIVDTPPTLGLLSISALYAADNAVIPTNPDFLSSRGLVSLNGTIESINRNRTAGALPYRVLFCKYDKRKSLHRLTVEQVRAAFPTYDTIIRDNVALGEAPAANADIFSYAPRSYGAQDYTAFVAEYVRTYKVRHLNHKY